MTKAQREAINAIINWSTIPGATMAYASQMVQEAEKQLPYPSECHTELETLGGALMALQEAFGWHPIPEAENEEV